MRKLPAFQFYPGDWRKDPGVQALSYEERGLWVEMLCLMHESEVRGKLLLGGKPYPEDRLARALGVDVLLIRKVISDLITLNIASRCPHTGAVMCRRMVRDEELSEIRATSGAKGGNPAFKKGAPNPYYHKQTDNQIDNQKITPSSSSSSSSSTSVLPKEKGASAPARARFEKPSIESILLQCSKIMLPNSEGYAFQNYYESNGWRVGKNPMKSWTAALQNWKLRYEERRSGNQHRPESREIEEQIEIPRL